MGRAWQQELIRWDDESRPAGTPSEQRDLMISHTTTEQAFDRVALAGLSLRYESIANFNNIGTRVSQKLREWA